MKRADLLHGLAREQQIWRQRCLAELSPWAIEALRPMGQRPARHHKLLIRHLEKVAHGEISRLMVLMPPGHAKSAYSSILFPPWFFAQHPNQDLIGASHGADLAEDFSGRIQRVIRDNSELLGYELASENVKAWRTTNGGFYRAAGIGGSITGRRANGAIIDDPLRGAEDAESTVVRDKQWEWYQAELYTRLKPGAWIILIMTRWHEDDLGGRLLQAAAAGGDQWTVLKLPAICDSVDDLLKRQIGEPLWPQMYGIEELERRRTNAGPYVWGALYQQDPKPRGASFFALESLLVESSVLAADGKKQLAPEEAPTKTDIVFCVIDTAVKSGAEHNSTAVTWYSYNSLTRPQCTLILDWDIVQIEGAGQAAWLPSVHARGEELARLCGARSGYAGAFIEDKATGTVLIQQSENQARQENRRSLARAIDSKLTAMGKEERAIAAAPYIIAGQVKITQWAFDKVKVHKGKSANHLLSQVTDFRLGSKQKDGLDLLDTFCYGVLITCGSSSGERKGI